MGLVAAGSALMGAAYLRAPQLRTLVTSNDALDTYLKGCSGKIAQTRKQAVAAGARRGSEAYCCVECGSWHTGRRHKPRSGPRESVAGPSTRR